MNSNTVLISGLGIAGATLAYWLARNGFAPTVIERAPAPRTGGYVIDFWGTGYDITESMGLLPHVLAAGYRVREVRIVNDHEKRVGGFDAEVFRSATHDRFISLPRGELCRILWQSIEGRVETIFGNTIVELNSDLDGVSVRFQHGSPRRFDLVIGADGLHSVVRELAFGPEADFERFLGYTVAAFDIRGYRPRDEDVYVIHSEPGKMVNRFAMRDDLTMILVVVADDDARAIDVHDPSAIKGYLHGQLSGVGWECPQILAAMDLCEEIYFDRVSQIRMKRWSKGRAALVGDAAFAPSLLAGEGAGLGLTAAYVLAGELARAEHHDQAFDEYERRLRPLLVEKQNAAARFAGAFAPKTRLGLFVRDLVTKAMVIPWIGRRAIGSSLVDEIELPDYGMQDRSPGRTPTAR